jgi:carbamoyl-phosphate synthase large subunit
MIKSSNNADSIIEDEYLIRRKAVELGIPVITTIELAEVFVDGIDWLNNNTLTIAETVN